MKLLVVPKEKNFSSEFAEGYLLPLEEYSVSYSVKFTLEEVKSIVKMGKTVFVVMNKNIFNHEILSLEKVLTILDEIKVAGVFFYDLSILSIVRRLGLNLPLIWNQTHMVTNYNTINYYASKGVMGASLSNEITLDEMVEIRKKTTVKLFVNIIYRPIMSFSRRSLVSNYSKTSGNPCDSADLVIHEKVSGEDFIVREEKEGTSFFQGKIVNGISALSTMILEDFDYGIVDLSNLPDEVIDVVLPIVKKMMETGDVDGSKVSELIGDYTGFLYKKTIYKVK